MIEPLGFTLNNASVDVPQYQHWKGHGVRGGTERGGRDFRGMDGMSEVPYARSAIVAFEGFAARGAFAALGGPEARLRNTPVMPARS